MEGHVELYPDDVWQDGGRRPVDPHRRRKLLIGIGALAVAVLAVLGFLGVKVGALFSDGTGGPVIRVGADPVPGADPATSAPPPAGAPAAVAGVEVYSPTGDRDNAGRASRVIDGDPRTNWRTFNYKQQFPALKPGVGLMVSFASAVQLASLSVQSPSPGTVIEVRSAQSSDASLDDTTFVVGTTLGDGTTDVSLAGSQPVTHILLWITKLGGSEGSNLTQIDELTFRRAAG